MTVVVFAVLLLALLPLIHLLTKGRSSLAKRLPPGSLGIPIIGQSLGLLRAMRNNTAEKWLEQRTNKYGPISKMSLFGSTAVFLTGQAANKFIFYSDALALQQPQSMTRILGKRNILELTGQDHRRVREAVGQFLKHEMLKKYVGKIDEEVKHHLNMNWIGQQNVTVLPSMKKLTFEIIGSLMFGLERGPVKEGLAKDLTDVIAGLWAVPVNLPFTNFHKSLRASGRARKVLTKITREKKIALQRRERSPSEDLITYLLRIDSEDKGSSLTEEEIVDNAMLVMVAGHDTSSILLTFMIRHLANDPVTYNGVLQDGGFTDWGCWITEQEEIAKSKTPGEALTWDDLTKMKYTWRVAMETLRMIPPVFGGFRRVLRDIQFNGYLIPKGWQIFWASCMTQMDAETFKEPSRFDPSRFENQSSVPPYSFVAFGGGQRICPGNEFARMETLVTMHYLTTRFKWRLRCKDDVFTRDPMPSPSQGLPIQLEPRNNLWRT